MNGRTDCNDESLRLVLLGRGRGGLRPLSWAADHQDKVAGFAGIYSVCNLASYPATTTGMGVGPSHGPASESAP